MEELKRVLITERDKFIKRFWHSEKWWRL